MDELSMLVKRIDQDGTLHLTPLGTMYPANFGLGPVAVLGERETLCGVLALGSEHTTQESPTIYDTKPDVGEDYLGCYFMDDARRSPCSWSRRDSCTSRSDGRPSTSTTCSR